MTELQALDPWEFDREDHLAAATIVALDRLNPPDLRVEIQSNYGGVIVVRLVDGERTDPDALFVRRAARLLHRCARRGVGRAPNADPARLAVAAICSIAEPDALRARASSQGIAAGGHGITSAIS